MNALRGQSKERKTSRKVSPAPAPGPSYMTSDQFGMAAQSSSPVSASHSYTPKRPSPLKSSISSSAEESNPPKSKAVDLQKTWAAQYLSDLRNHRVARPSGARPLPAKANPRGERERSHTPAPIHSPVSDLPPRAMSAMSARRSQSSFSHDSTTPSRPSRQRADVSARNPSLAAAITKPLKPGEVVATATYIERGMRWMEKEEAVALRDAMEDLDLRKKEEDEARIQAAAQAEASELVYQHIHPGAVRPATDGPYRYKEHLRKNSYAKARTASVGPVPGIAPPTGLARDLPRSISVSSNDSDPLRSISRSPSGASEPESRKSNESDQRPTGRRRRSAGFPQATAQSEGEKKLSRPNPFGRRRSSGRRNVSGEVKAPFTGDQIWEEPEEGEDDRDRRTDGRGVAATATSKRRSHRVSFVQDLPPHSETTPPEATKQPFVYKKYISEIYKNPPTQSRNPAYTVNNNSVPTPLPEVPVKDGKEIRSEDIVKATSMRFSDRSAKLPTPTAVSDRPGRPIVSFDKNWTPPEEKFDVQPDSRKPEERAVRGSPSPFDRSRRARNSVAEKASVSAIHPAKAVENQAAKNTSLPGVNGHSSRQSDPVIVSVKPYSGIANVPGINLPDDVQGIPPRISISEPLKSNPPFGPSRTQSRSVEEPPKVTSSVPTFSFSGPSESTTPELSISEPPKANGNVPTFSISEPEAPKPSVTTPMISVSEPPSKPTANNSPTKSNARPLPDPRNVRPVPRTNTVVPTSRSHWSPMPTNPSRATTLCHQCNQPTERGAMRVSGQWFHPSCITCHQCNQALGHMDISAEPATIRTARLDRIARRLAGETLPETTPHDHDDGDGRLRFYCHLDWHELFAPRCHHCKTPIESGQDYQTAMGNVYHQGHFFCGECGDPFEEGKPYVKVDGWPWCVSCATKRTERRAPKCRACKGPVVGQYTVALGGEWHLDCFRCVGCAEPFGVDGKVFLVRDEGGEGEGKECAFCLRCMEREWKA